MAKWVYLFREGNADMRNLLGGKGANLAEMTNLGLPIPPGFTVTTEACTDYYNHGRSISEEIQTQIFDALALLEEKLGKKFGDTENPLLVSVRSGARASMPGMMDTILNLGLTDISVEGFAKRTGNPRFAYDSYRRFIQMFSDVVMEVPKSLFERVIDEIKEDRKVHFDTELTAEDLKEVIRRFKEIYKEKMGEEFPQEPRVQLMEAVKAVFRSWDNERAIVYRRMNDIPGDWGTAVNVQSMVFGNMGNTSGTGVAFTRNPSTGAKGIYGEYLINAQGEDVVAGIRTPQPITRLEEDLPEGAEFLLASQAANAGCVVLSKTQETTEPDQKNAVDHLNRALEKIGCKRQFDKVFAKDWDKLTDEDFKQLLSCGYHMENYRKPDLTQEKTFQSLYFMNMHLTEKKLQEAAKKLFLDKSCGKIFRIKGFMKNEKEQWIELNATKKNLVISPIKMGQEVIIVIGEQLDEDAIRSCLEA